MSAHTPGPWWVTESGVRDRGGYIAFVPHPTRYPDQEERYTAEVLERKANAALIAVLPELLEVARLLALATDEGDDAAQGTHYVGTDGRIRCKGSFLETIEKARAAIAKTEAGAL